MYCPVRKGECLKKKCAWYVEYRNECVVYTLARALELSTKAICELLEDKE